MFIGSLLYGDAESFEVGPVFHSRITAYLCFNVSFTSGRSLSVRSLRLLAALLNIPSSEPIPVARTTFFQPRSMGCGTVSPSLMTDWSNTPLHLAATPAFFLGSNSHLARFCGIRRQASACSWKAPV